MNKIWIVIVFLLICGCSNESNRTSLEAQIHSDLPAWKEDYHGVSLDDDGRNSGSQGIYYKYDSTDQKIASPQVVHLTEKANLSKIDARVSPKDARAGVPFDHEVISIFRDDQDRIILDPLEYTATIDQRQILEKGLLGTSTLTTKISSEKSTLSSSIRSSTTNSTELKTTVHPGATRPFNLYSSLENTWADGRSFVQLRAEPLVDLFNDPIADGTVIAFNINTSSGKTIVAYAYSIAGKAITYLRHPIESETWTVQAHCQGASSQETLTISFDAVTMGIPYEMDDGTLTVGPISTPSGALIADGTALYITVNPDEQRTSLVSYLDEGRSSIYLEDYLIENQENTLQLTCAGKSIKLTIP